MIEWKQTLFSSPFGKGLAQLAEKLGGRTEPVKVTKRGSSWAVICFRARRGKEPLRLGRPDCEREFSLGKA